MSKVNFSETNYIFKQVSASYLRKNVIGASLLIYRQWMKPKITYCGSFKWILANEGSNDTYYLVPKFLK